MKRRKILVLVPLLGLFLTGCSFQEGFRTVKRFLSENIYHPLKTVFESFMNGQQQDQKKEDQPSEGGEVTPSGDEEKDTDPYEVSEAEFKEAVTLNWKNLSYSASIDEGKDEPDTYDIRLLEDGSVYECEAIYDYYTFYRIFQHMDDGTYRYASIDSDDKWYTNFYYTADYYIENYYTCSLFLYEPLSQIKEQYASFTYTKETHLYSTHVVDEDDENITYDVSLKFEDKKLTSFNYVETYKVDSEDEEDFVRTVDAEFTKYGETVIDFDSLNIRDELYVVGRTFRIHEVNDYGMFDNNTYKKQEFFEGNSDASLIFKDDGTFVLHLELDFDLTTTPKDYSGTYVYEKFGTNKITFTFTEGMEFVSECQCGDAVDDGYGFFIGLEIMEGENDLCRLLFGSQPLE